MGFTPMPRRVLLKIINESTGSAIFLPDGVHTSEVRKAIIFVVGQDVQEVKEGDTVFIVKHYGREVELDGTTYKEYPVNEILGVLK